MFKCIIIQSGYQIDAQHKSSSPISIPLRQYPKDFQMPDDVFDHHPLRCQCPVKLFLLVGQLPAFRFLERRPRLRVQLKDALITAVRQTFNFFWQVGFTMFIKRKIVPRAFGKRFRDLPPEIEVVVVDVAESPIERPKKNKNATIRARKSGI